MSSPAAIPKKFRRMSEENRLAHARFHRGSRVQITTRLGDTYTGRVLAVGRALHGTSTDWIALAHQGYDRFVSLATVDTIERVAENWKP